MDFLEEMLTRCRTEGIATAVDTSGYATRDEFERIAKLTDLFLYDLKLMDEKLHEQYTGKSNAIIRENLELLISRGCPVEVRIPLIPGITDAAENLNAIAEYLATLERIPNISLLPYNQLSEDKIGRYGLTDRLGHLETQNSDTISAIANKMVTRGFSVHIGG